jgi:iron-sulfur cluster assembly protein/iron-sulfur cluster insertion protein
MTFTGGERANMSASVTGVTISRSRQPVTLSEAAVAKVSELLQQESASGMSEGDLSLRIAVKPGGCSGFSYDMFFDSSIEDDDLVSTFDQVKVVVDPASAELLKGAKLDYTDGLQGAGFHVVNPNATRTCGCGSSFS